LTDHHHAAPDAHGANSKESKKPMKTFGQILKAIKGDNVTIWDYCAPHYNAQDASVRIYFDDMEKDTREVFHVYLATGRVEHASIWGYDKEKNNWR
jgi:hypothetical protein